MAKEFLPHWSEIGEVLRLTKIFLGNLKFCYLWSLFDVVEEPFDVALDKPFRPAERLHEINERNRIALERENARRRAEEKRKAEQKHD